MILQCYESCQHFYHSHFLCESPGDRLETQKADNNHQNDHHLTPAPRLTDETILVPPL